MDQALKNPARHYSSIDRMWHRLAFAMIEMQIDLAAREMRQHQAELMMMRPGAPVFITALPRSGTTLLLDVLAKDAVFACHTYRDMPALFCPMTWRQFSARFRRKADVHERAHGDGMSVGFDSPEAFEEALWLHFWPDHFEPKQITLWAKSEAHREFESFFDAHMRAVILNARAESRPNAERYISKNNGNIARTGWLKRDHPTAHVLVPFRHPAAHITSLWRQHQNFGQLHQTDNFAKRYMADLGHFEFGALHRPVHFAGFAPRQGETPDQPIYWTRYWIAAYRHLLEGQRSEVDLIDFDGICENPAARLRSLAELLLLHRPGLVTAEATRFRAPPLPDWSSLDVPMVLRDEAEELFAALRWAKAV